ncbi:MAG: urease accessory protein UreE [Pseudomonadota bacterium]
MSDILTSHSYLATSRTNAADTATLSYEDRFLRRKVVPLGSGRHLLINLAQTTSLDHGGRLVTTDGLEIEVRAAPEALYKVTGPDLTRLAWHIGNRHTPCQIMGDHLLIQRDPVIGHMLEHLGATVEEVTEPFTPEGGAYGHGRTHSHEHGKTAHAH